MQSPLREVAAGSTAVPDPELVSKFSECMDDDLNVAAAWGAVFDWVRDTNRQMAENSLDAAGAAAALAAWDKLDTVLGVGKREEAEVPPARLKVCWPIAGAVHGVAGARITSTRSNSLRISA